MGSKQFIVWDTKSEKELKKISIPDNVVKPTSFLQDFIIDEKNNRVIIADMTQGDLKSAAESAFIVIDTETGAAKRMAEKHASMMPDFEGGFALNPIAIDPNNKWVYFGALHGKKVYRVPAKSFDNEASLNADIEYYAPKSYSDGIAVDNHGNVFVTNIEQNELGLTNSKDGFKTIASLPEGQTWPDGLWLKDGFLYSTVDQLNRVPALNNGKDDSMAPYIIVRTKLTK
jgi:sugar lactone lactonase YvrE